MLIVDPMALSASVQCQNLLVLVQTVLVRSGQFWSWLQAHPPCQLTYEEDEQRLPVSIFDFDGIKTKQTTRFKGNCLFYYHHCRFS